MSERKDGWYWVQMPGGLWSVALYCEGSFVSIDAIGDDEKDLIIGGRIPTPDEPWRCVPSNGTTEEMDDAARGLLLMLSMRSDISYERLHEDLTMRGDTDLIDALPDYALTGSGHIPKAAQADILFRLMCSAAPRPEDV